MRSHFLGDHLYPPPLSPPSPSGRTNDFGVMCSSGREKYILCINSLVYLNAEPKILTCRCSLNAMHTHGCGLILWVWSGIP